MFDQDSRLVKIWVSLVLSGSYTYSQVPDLFNLRGEVEKKLIEIGYNTNQEV